MGRRLTSAPRIGIAGSVRGHGAGWKRGCAALVLPHATQAGTSLLRCLVFTCTLASECWACSIGPAGEPSLLRWESGLPILSDAGFRMNAPRVRRHKFAQRMRLVAPDPEAAPGTVRGGEMVGAFPTWPEDPRSVKRGPCDSNVEECCTHDPASVPICECMSGVAEVLGRVGDLSVKSTLRWEGADIVLRPAPLVRERELADPVKLTASIQASASRCW